MPDLNTPVDIEEDWEPTHTFRQFTKGVLRFEEPVMRVFKRKDGQYYLSAIRAEGMTPPRFFNRECVMRHGNRASKIEPIVGAMVAVSIPLPKIGYTGGQSPADLHKLRMEQKLTEVMELREIGPDHKPIMNPAPVEVKAEPAPVVTAGKVSLGWHVAWAVLYAGYWPHPDSPMGFAETFNGDCAKLADQRGPNGEKVFEVFVRGNGNETNQHHKVLIPPTIEFLLPDFIKVPKVDAIEEMCAQIDIKPEVIDNAEEFTDCLDPEDAELVGA